MAKWVKALSAMPDDLRLIPRTYVVEYSDIHRYTVTHTHTSTWTNTSKLKN